MLNAGTKLGRYEIQSQLGEGGMGQVWRARDTRLNREVAIKILPPSFANDEDRLRRFEQEARAISALNHPRYATIYHALALAYQEPTEAAIERAKQAIDSMLSKGVMLDISPGPAALGELYGMSGRIAEGLDAIAESLAIVERTGERFWEAEIWRIKGEVLMKSGLGIADCGLKEPRLSPHLRSETEAQTAEHDFSNPQSSIRNAEFEAETIRVLPICCGASACPIDYRTEKRVDSSFLVNVKGTL
jgi:hypothetical protein